MSIPGPAGQAARPAAQPQAAASPGQQAHAPAQQAGPQPSQQAGAQQTPAQQQAQPSPRAAARTSSPARLRIARTLATAAALLTGVVATGSFDTSGVNAPPNVIAAQWEAAERAGNDTAAAQLEVARTVAEATAAVPEDQRSSDPTTFRSDVGSAAEWLAGSGVATSGSLVDLALAGQDAMAAAAAGEDAVALYEGASSAATTAIEVSDAVAEERATDLATGSRSTLTAVVGGLATLLLVGLLVWLALLTRRIVNVPLLIATAITAGLTYVSLDPSALPVNFDQQVEAGSLTAQALEEVRLARVAQYEHTLGLGTAADAVDRATESVTALGDTDLSAEWRTVADAQQELEAAGEGGGIEAVLASQQGFRAAEDALADLADTRLGGSVGSVGRPALVTSGLALLLGIVAAGLAWAGVTQRLRDYR